MMIFGPINSRRFGLSLGVDLSGAKKQCNFDCVYCELDAAKPIREQESVLSVEEILTELKAILKKDVKFDVLTLTANGEPSLYPHLKELILELKKLIKDKKILILSNGTAVLDEEKMRTLMLCDIVKFSLDSANEKTFYKIDRALKGIDLSKMIEKMAEFRTKFSGALVMEILVVKGFNDNEEEFILLNDALAKIAPMRVDLSSIDRPPAYAVSGVDEMRLLELSGLISSVPVFIAKRHKAILSFSEEELLKTLRLRPQSELDVECFDTKSKRNLQTLLEKGQIKSVNLAGVKFYKA
ncbi:radical SAM protein [Campylobacter upsaliensis]|uniref:Fe-S oxidoreductase n=1 Tax=Campylobacter upsaliensis TaxID=28080 RepID=A0A381EJ20_CAMUP|nr:radical SAM protein [Campylobacter upsaliensis]MCR2099750.1 radical SAM protein [Campylobacter upsaliensis]MCR2119895.1 radical SAM protein [Campylobacter upsaliensis]MCR2121706.1 radical SAM protein [Campylobacter upsaliensis]MCR2124115.1 radical SAM protein [Campylobacter upsaliensis]SUX26902.1 Putative Fe-S oxidoreductase [Campylobacter upsaliensis]